MKDRLNQRIRRYQTLSRHFRKRDDLANLALANAVLSELLRLRDSKMVPGRSK